MCSFSLRAERCLAHCGTPHMNLAPATYRAAVARGAVEQLAVLGSEHWVTAHSCATRPRPVRAVFLLERSPRLSLSVQEQPSSPVPLVPYVLGLDATQGRRRERFALYAQMMSSAALMRQSCGAHDAPGAVAELMFTALERHGSAMSAAELA